MFYAEGPLLYFALTSIIYLFAYFLNPHWSLLIIAGAMAGFTTQTKAEGIFLVVPAVVALMLRTLTASTSQLKRQYGTTTLTFIVLVASVGLPWLIYRFWIAPYAGTLSSDQATHIFANLSLLPGLGVTFWEWVSRPTYQGMFYLVFPATLILVALNGKKYLIRWPHNYLFGHTVLTLAPYIIFFLAQPQWVELARLGRYLFVFTGASYCLFAIQTVDAFRPSTLSTGMPRTRWLQWARRGVIVGLAFTIALTDVGADIMGRASKPIYISRPASLWRELGQDMDYLLPLTPSQRRQWLEATNGQPAFGRLIQVVLDTTPETENVGLWAFPDHPWIRSPGYIYQKSYSLLYPRKVFLLSDPTELEAAAVQAAHIGTVISYDRELPPGVLQGLPLYQSESRFAVVRTILSEDSVRTAGHFTSAPIQFAEGIHLLGYQWVTNLLPPDMLLVLNWQNTDVVPRSYTVFVHIFDSQGTLLAQHDGLPGGGQAPTQYWQIGSAIIDAHPLSLTHADLPTAKFCIEMYDSVTGERLPILATDGYIVADNTACRPFSNQPYPEDLLR